MIGTPKGGIGSQEVIGREQWARPGDPPAILRAALNEMSSLGCALKLLHLVDPDLLAKLGDRATPGVTATLRALQDFHSVIVPASFADSMGQIAHITDWPSVRSSPGAHTLADAVRLFHAWRNLVPLCLMCHNAYDSGLLPVELVKQARRAALGTPEGYRALRLVVERSPIRRGRRIISEGIATLAPSGEIAALIDFDAAEALAELRELHPGHACPIQIRPWPRSLQGLMQIVSPETGHILIVTDLGPEKLPLGAVHLTYTAVQKPRDPNHPRPPE